MIAPVGPELAPYQPSQRYLVVDERHVGAEDLPVGNLMGAVLGLEQSRGPGDLVRVAGRLVEWLRDPGDDGLKRAFADWVRQMAEGFVADDAALPAVRTLEGVRMTLVERVAEWPKQWFREGHEQGVREGREQGVREGIEQGVREGIEQGVREGIEQGLEHERALLRRLAVSRFGTETAERVSGVLAGIADPEGLAEVGEWLVRCGTGDEFLARVEPAADEADRHGDRGTSRGRSHSRGD